MNAIDFFHRSAAFYPERAMYRFEGETWTYAQVDRLASQIGHGLRDEGITYESKCAVLSRNDPIAFTVLLGILKAQAAWVPLNVGNGTDENLYILDFFDVEILFFQKEFQDFARAAKERIPRIRQLVCLDDESSIGSSFEAWVGHRSDAPVQLPWDPDGVCMVRGTGGTTGRPKGVMNTNRNIEVMTANYLSNLRFDAPPVYLACAPLSHAAGIFAFVMIALGGTMVIHRKVDPQSVLRSIEEDRISLIYLPPTAIYKLLSEPNVREFDYSSLRHFLYGAAPTSSVKLGEAISVFGPVMTQGYGQTEVPSSVTFMAPSDHLDAEGNIHEKRLLSCGRPTPFVRVALMDEEGTPVPRGELGEIVVQGGLVMKGYYKNPDATAESRKFGWHRTGDVAYQDEDGFIYIQDRIKEMIITGGFNVYPLEVEQVLLSHSAVQDCAVVGVPDETWGEAIKAAVELKAGQVVTEEELIQLCKSRVGSIKAPKAIDFVDSLPRSPVGKVMRKEVKKWYGG
ncbi:MAG: AMP-binding protein [Ectothiorhodospiraceae bacterium]|nr:AMP-binding protein [Ectothiorhodospiraceae bacterium]